ncbi:twin-arginine translocation pathway signal [Rhodoplanes roseus]|uniref:Twin-arginine translocation pathway signal n=1 Tax=Rhodoplanes roseus TaxID=29409 RepID=A0A327KWQ4_9BRAD|nr:twin-arginine translocation pathway signal [Rhodoplanes roseus]
MLAGALAALITTGLLTPAGQAEPNPAVLGDRGEPITVEARPIFAFEPGKPDRVRFGRLQFRGGLELTSSHKAFGGISGLKMLDAERFVAVTDKSDWLTGRIVYQGARPVGIADAAMAAMLGPDGRTLAARGWYDTEAITADQNGVVYVGIERVNRIVRFEFGKQGVAAPARLVPWPQGLTGLPNNRGIEALAAVPKGSPLAGALIVITERALDPAGNIKAALVGGPRPGLFAIARHDGFDISDATVLPDGDLLLLERRFTWTTGVAMRLRRIPIAAIAPGAVVDGPMLAAADMGFQIDNMEALGTHLTADGETVLTLISDDNFSFLQRTLLLQFTLVDE